MNPGCLSNSDPGGLNGSNSSSMTTFFNACPYSILFLVMHQGCPHISLKTVDFFISYTKLLAEGLIVLTQNGWKYTFYYATQLDN